MRRRDFIKAAAGSASIWPLVARAQQSDRMRRLGVLISAVTEADAEGQARVAALRLGLLEHGWVEGRNLEVDYRWGGANPSRIRAYAAELTALNPDVIFAAPSAALAEVQRATRTIPIVFAQVSDPVGTGFVDSLAHPGGNITGFALFEFTVGAKWLELLKQFRSYVDAGGLMSYGSSLLDAYRQTGVYAGRVLKGEKPGDLPIARPTTFELIINLKIASVLGIAIPPTLLGRADEVIE
jgi:ABC-type uncharacterized transport system substrate-binding protein